MQHYRAGQRLWWIVDAKDKILGRLASRVTGLLIGKHKPIYKPIDYECGDNVIIINSKHIHLSGTKWDRKLIRWHTGYIGNLKEFTCKQRHEKDPTELVRRAINGMLPKNRLRATRMQRLHIFPEEKHPFGTQFPLVYDPLGEDALYKELKY